MKNINDIAVIVQARLNSERLPRKMIKDFNGSSLFEVLLNKLNKSNIIKSENVYISIFEDELKNIAKKYDFNIFNRSFESASEDNNIKLIYEWWDKLPQQYCVLISACNPLLKIETIDEFINKFQKSEKEGAFAVFEKKTYYWNKNCKPITDWKNAKIMNTKQVEPVYEAGHCLYASKLSFLEEELWMDNKVPPEPLLVKIDELECFDIDYEWQFNIAEKLYENLYEQN